MYIPYIQVWKISHSRPSTCISPTTTTLLSNECLLKTELSMETSGMEKYQAIGKQKRSNTLKTPRYLGQHQAHAQVVQNKMSSHSFQLCLSLIKELKTTGSQDTKSTLCFMLFRGHGAQVYNSQNVTVVLHDGPLTGAASTPQLNACQGKIGVCAQLSAEKPLLPGL